MARDEKACPTESIKELFNNGVISTKLDTEIRLCYSSSRGINFSDKEIAESVSSDYLYKKSLHNKINNLLSFTRTSKVDPTKIIKKSPPCENKANNVDFLNPNYLMDQLKAIEDYENCEANRDKNYKAELEENTIRKYTPGIRDKILPEKIVRACIKLDNYRFEENYNAPIFIDCISYALNSDKVADLQDPQFGLLKVDVIEFWKNDTSKDNLCKTFYYHDKSACKFLLNR